MNKLFLFLFFTTSFLTFAQELDSLGVNNTDITLEEVFVFGKEPIFKTEEDRKKYLILKYRVKKVYPYAKLAADELQRIKKVLDTLPNNRQKKKFTKKIQEETESKFSQELKKLSRSQGKILIKLIYRQTGDSAFNLVKDLRSGWRAFWYNNTAWLYDLSLKSIYEPMQVEEDFWIEDILQRAFSNGQLEPQSSAFPIDYRALEKKWLHKEE
ncbi:MAG: DUF4294 domain-containing protein [Capnocytophaga sp.]|nr:DUF4294 domain-containing protein [Capnocytophaga sp.]